MDNLTLNLKNSLNFITDKHGNKELIIAYSGGIDSQVLLHALMYLKQNNMILNEITVCHVNHGLSDNATHWQQFAEQVCAQYPVNLIIKCVDVVFQPQKSLEALARDARYDALKSLRDTPSIVLTGHHSDDQTETFLLALKRGAGLKGLASMSTVTNLEQHILARPLLAVSRNDIEQYAKQNALTWIEDESNLDTSFDRNFLRQEVIPLIRQRWPSINSTINRSAMHCAAGQDLLNELAEQDLAVCKSDVTSLKIDALKQLSPARFNNLIRFFMAQHQCLMPSTQQLNQVLLQIQSGDDKTPEIKVGNNFFRRFKGRLYLTPDYQDVSCWHACVQLYKNNAYCQESTLTLPDYLGELVFNIKKDALSIEYSLQAANEKTQVPLTQLPLTQLPIMVLPNATQKVTVRFSHINPKCLPHYRQHSRSLKKVLQELSIAPWQRKRIAFLYYDDQLVSAIGHFVCKPFIAIER